MNLLRLFIQSKKKRLKKLSTLVRKTAKHEQQLKSYSLEHCPGASLLQSLTRRRGYHLFKEAHSCLWDNWWRRLKYLSGGALCSLETKSELAATPHSVGYTCLCLKMGKQAKSIIHNSSQSFRGPHTITYWNTMQWDYNSAGWTILLAKIILISCSIISLEIHAIMCVSLNLSQTVVTTLDSYTKANITVSCWWSCIARCDLVSCSFAREKQRDNKFIQRIASGCAYAFLNWNIYANLCLIFAPFYNTTSCKIKWVFW